MKISLEWLREYADLDAPLDELVRLLVDTGTEVDRVERVADGTIVAQVLDLAAIPSQPAESASPTSMSATAGRSAWSPAHPM